MSILYRVVLLCDRCDEEHELHEDTRVPCDARWSKISVRGWKDTVSVDKEQAEYGHLCPNCRKEVR